MKKRWKSIVPLIIACVLCAGCFTMAGFPFGSRLRKASAANHFDLIHWGQFNDDIVVFDVFYSVYPLDSSATLSDVEEDFFNWDYFLDTGVWLGNPDRLSYFYVWYDLSTGFLFWEGQWGTEGDHFMPVDTVLMEVTGLFYSVDLDETVTLTLGVTPDYSNFYWSDYQIGKIGNSRVYAGVDALGNSAGYYDCSVFYDSFGSEYRVVWGETYDFCYMRAEYYYGFVDEPVFEWYLGSLYVFEGTYIHKFIQMSSGYVPLPEYSEIPEGYYFMGWYDNPAFDGDPVYDFYEGDGPLYPRYGLYNASFHFIVAAGDLYSYFYYGSTPAFSIILEPAPLLYNQWINYYGSFGLIFDGWYSEWDYVNMCVVPSSRVTFPHSMGISSEFFYAGWKLKTFSFHF